MALIDTLERLDTLKREHLSDEQLRPSGRPHTDVDRRTIAAMLTGTSVSVDEVDDYVAVIVAVIMRDLGRAGVLRSAKRAELRELIMTVAVEALLTGLHHRK